MKATLFSIECVSNLHVGNGQENFGLIDNLIQRDAITDLPCIHSSSLKGALREHCEKECDKEVVIKLFGSEPEQNKNKKSNTKEKNSGEKFVTTQGSLIFTDAQLITLAVASTSTTSNKPYCLYSCEDVKKDLKSAANDLGVQLEEDTIEEVTGKAVIETSLAEFKEMADNEHLPVIARNYLKDGISANLWYEQVLPRKSRLYFFIIHDDKLDDSAFKTAITSKLVQIGANASIGYGLCKIQEVNINQKQEQK